MTERVVLERVSPVSPFAERAARPMGRAALVFSNLFFAGVVLIGSSVAIVSEVYEKYQ